MNELAKKFAESIPMDELFSEIKRVTELPDLKFTYKIVESRTGMPRITFQSQDLVDKVGFLKLIFQELVISEFNSEIFSKDGEYIFWCTVTISYEHPDGGSNGKTFYMANYSKKRGWEFDKHY